jgi:hypothetical protein
MAAEAAIFGLAGTLVGAVGTFLGQYFASRHALAKEREARESQQRHELKVKERDRICAAFTDACEALAILMIAAPPGYRQITAEELETLTIASAKAKRAIASLLVYSADACQHPVMLDLRKHFLEASAFPIVKKEQAMLLFTMVTDYSIWYSADPAITGRNGGATSQPPAQKLPSTARIANLDIAQVQRSSS